MRGLKTIWWIVVHITSLITCCRLETNFRECEISKKDFFVDYFKRETKISDWKVPSIGLSSKLLNHQPHKFFNFDSHSVSQECQKSSAELYRALEKFELWALRSKSRFFVKCSSCNKKPFQCMMQTQSCRVESSTEM
jgi:hypothetical protein